MVRICNRLDFTEPPSKRLQDTRKTETVIAWISNTFTEFLTLFLVAARLTEWQNCNRVTSRPLTRPRSLTLSAYSNESVVILYGLAIAFAPRQKDLVSRSHRYLYHNLWYC